MKKLVSLLLMVAMLLSVCSFAAADGRVQVEFWYGLGGATGEIVKNTIAEFNAMQDKYEVIGVTKGSYTETFQDIQAPIASGNPPALAILEYSQISKLADKNVLEDLTPYIENSDYNPDDIVPAFYNQGKFGDKIFALPLQGTTQVFYYNTKIMAAAGIENPEEMLSSWEGTLEVSRKAKEAGYHAILAFVIQMEGVSEVRANTDTHPEFGDALDDAKNAGVEIRFLRCVVEPDSLTIR